MNAYKTYTFFDRFCLPKDSSLFSQIAQKFSIVSLETILESLIATKDVIGISILIAFIISFIFSFLLEKCTSVIVTISIAGFYVASGYLAFLTHKGYKGFEGSDSHEDQKKYKLLKAVFFFICVLMAISVCAMCCLWSKILLAVKIIAVILSSITHLGCG